MDQQPVQIIDRPEFSIVLMFNEVCKYVGKVVFTGI